jgi:hypothetical protein
MSFFQRCWQRRWLRGLVWTLVTLVTLYALLCAWANWSGARQWRDAQAMLKAEGETLDFRLAVAEPIPEADNFCAIPLLKDLALVVEGDPAKGEPGQKRARLEALKLPANGKAGERPKGASAGLGERVDLKAWADWLRRDGTLSMPADSGNAARDVLAALSKHDEVVRELAAGLERPLAQWTPPWKTRELPRYLFAVALPHYSELGGVNQMLALQGIAAARAGDASRAHESLQIQARLNRACLEEPFLISLLVAASGSTSLVNATWELCDAQAGTAEDFKTLEAALAKLDFRQGALRAWRGELAAGVDAVQFFKVSRAEALGLAQGGPESSALEGLGSQILPAGFFDANSAVLADREFVRLIKPLRDEHQTWPAVIRSAKDFEAEILAVKERIWSHPSWVMASMIAPATTKIIYSAAYAQALVDQAVVACALERHRLEHGGYPDSLDALRRADGRPVAPDLFSGKPLRYRTTADGKYALWSVGFDGKDNDGKRVTEKGKPMHTKFSDPNYSGDWVWDFPVK